MVGRFPWNTRILAVCLRSMRLTLRCSYTEFSLCSLTTHVPGCWSPSAARAPRLAQLLIEPCGLEKAQSCHCCAHTELMCRVMAVVSGWPAAASAWPAIGARASCMANPTSYWPLVSPRNRKALESVSLVNDEKMDTLETQLKEAKYISEDADRKYDEVTECMSVCMDPLVQQLHKFLQSYLQCKPRPALFKYNRRIQSQISDLKLLACLKLAISSSCNLPTCP